MAEVPWRWPRVWRTSMAAVALLLATACQNIAEPTAENWRDALDSGLAAADATSGPALRVRYLPPLGDTDQTAQGEFANGLPLEVAVFRLAEGDATAEGQALQYLSMQNGIAVNGDTYLLSWAVTDPYQAERVRLEIRMVGSGETPVCNEFKGECLGYLDVRVVERSGPGRGGGSSTGLLTVPSGSTFQASFKVLVATEFEELATLAGQGGLDPVPGNCQADDLALPSQGLQAVGAGLQAVGAGLQAVGAGGLFLGDWAALEDRAVTMGQVGSVISGFDQTLSGSGANKTVLLVLDDFGGTYELPSALLKGKLKGLDLNRLAGQVSHGALVYYELNALLGELMRAQGKGVDTSGAPYVEYGKGKVLRVQAVDARDSSGHIDTDAAAANLADALTSARAAGFTRAVVNMSFAVVPCAVVADLENVMTEDPETGGEPYGFEDYVLDLLAYNGISDESPTWTELEDVVRQPLDLLDDALFAQLACPLGSAAGCGAAFDSIVFVAASGNYGLDFSLYPAAFPGVISVGSHPFEAQAGFGTTRSDFSNAADVVAAGDVILLRQRDGLGLAYVGTSYSAPIVSLFAALDQRSANPRCDAGTHTDPTKQDPPALAPAQDTWDDQPLLPGFVGTGGGISAVTELCSGG